MKHWKIQLLFWAFFGSIAALGAVELKIVCTADLHGRVDKLAYLGTAIRAEKPDIILDCGDTFSGNFYSDADQGAAMVAALTRIGVDAWVWGNHEFEWDFAALRTLRTKFPAAVLGDWSAPELPGVLPYVILVKKGIRCAVIGMGAERQAARLLPDQKFTAEAPEEFLRRTLSAIRRESVDLVILVCHRGIYGKTGSLRKLLGNFPEIQLVFGGHTHRANAGEKLGAAYYLQSAGHGANAAAAVVEFNWFKRVKNISSYLIEPAETAAADIAELGAAQKAAFAESGKRVVATLPQILAQPEAREYDVGFARLGAEALRTAARSDFGLFQCGVGRRSRTAAITRLELFNLYPYRSEVIVATLTAEELANLLAEEIRLARSSKSSTSFGFAGFPGRLSGAIRPERFPAQSTVAMGSFTFCASSALEAVRRDPARWRRFGASELMVLENHLQSLNKESK